MSYYLFIDGAYFQEAFRAAMQGFFAEVPRVNYRDLSGRFHAPRRVFYYDAVDRNLIGDETEAQRDERVKERDDFHAYLNSLPLWNVREGFVSRGRRVSRRSQKAVDVQLAVDAIEHAVARNMTSAGFVIGDLDFEPLLFSLNRFGVQTTVWYERGTVSQELLEAADISEQLTINAFHQLAEPSFQERVHPPTFNLGPRRPELPARSVGRWGGREVELLQTNDGSLFLWVAAGVDAIREPSILVHHPSTDPDRVQLAFVMNFGGQLNWLAGL